MTRLVQRSAMLADTGLAAGPQPVVTLLRCENPMVL